MEQSERNKEILIKSLKSKLSKVKSEDLKRSIEQKIKALEGNKNILK